MTEKQQKRRKSFSPMLSLNESEALFVQYIAYGGVKNQEAWNLVWPERSQEAFAGSNNLVRRVNVAAALRYLKETSDEEAARDFLLSQVHSPSATPTAKKQAAESILRLSEKANASEGVDRWIQRLAEVGAEVRKPIPAVGDEMVVALADLIDGRAYIHLSGKAMADLLHLAGAPWNDQDPDARLSPLQLELLLREERMVFCLGGSGVGKSAVQGALGLAHLCLPNQKIAIIASTYDKCCSEFEYVWKGYTHLFGTDGATTVRESFVAEKRNYNMLIETIWNSSIDCFSTEHESGAAILGKEFDLVLYGEGALVSPEIHQRKVVRALMRRVKLRKNTRNPTYYRKTGRVFGCTTPDGYGGLVSEEWDRVLKTTENQPERLHVGESKNWLDTVYLREASALENPAYSRDAFEAARRSLPPDIFQEQFMGRRIRRSGLIYKEWDEGTMLVAMPSPEAVMNMRLGVGFDTGKHFSAGLMGMDEDGILWRLGEVVSAEQKTQDDAADLKGLLIRILGPIFGTDRYHDLKGHIDIWPCDPHSQVKMELMDELDAPISDAEAGFKNNLMGSIDRIRKKMSEGQFRVVREHNYEPIMGHGFRYEVAKYVWKVVKTVKGWNDGATRLEPVKLDDHTLDELRYVGCALLDLGLPKRAHQRPSAEEQSSRASGFVGLGQSLRQQFLRQSQASGLGEAYRRVHAA